MEVILKTSVWTLLISRLRDGDTEMTMIESDDIDTAIQAGNLTLMIATDTGIEMRNVVIGINIATEATESIIDQIRTRITYVPFKQTYQRLGIPRPNSVITNIPRQAQYSILTSFIEAVTSAAISLDSEPCKAAIMSLAKSSEMPSFLLE